eukprot:Em0009g149a
MDLKVCAILALALYCVSEGKTHKRHKQCSGGCEGGIQTRAVRCIDGDGVLSEQCSRGVPLPYRFCQDHEKCATSGRPLAPPTDKHFLSNPDGSTSVVLLRNQGDACLLFQNTSSLDGLEVACTSKCTGADLNCQIIPPSYSITTHPNGGVVISLRGKQVMLPRPVASIELSSTATLTYANNLLAVRGVVRFGITAFHFFDNMLLYTFNGGMSRKHFGPGRLFICGSSVLFSYNAHLARQINDLYSIPAIALSSPNCPLPGNTAQLTALQGEDVEELSWQTLQAQKARCIPSVVQQGDLPSLIPAADSNQLPELLKPVPWPPRSPSLKPHQSPMQPELLSPTVASKASILPSAKITINYEARPLPSLLHTQPLPSLLHTQPLPPLLHTNHSPVQPLQSPSPHRSPPPKGTSRTVPLHTVVIFNGSKMASPMMIPVATGVELRATPEENKLLVVTGGHSVLDLASSVCIPVPPRCALLNTGGTLTLEDCGGSGRSTIAKGVDEVMVFDGSDVRWAWSEGVRGAVMVHVGRHWVLVSQSVTFSRVVCDALELMQKGVVFEFSLDDRGRLALWSEGTMLVQMTDVEVIHMKSTSNRAMRGGVDMMGDSGREMRGGVPALPKLLYSFNGTHLTDCSEHDCLTCTDAYLYVTKTSALCSNDPVLNAEMEVWLSSLHPQFEIRSSDKEQSVLYVAGERVIELSEVHTIGTLSSEWLRYTNGTLALETTGAQTTTVSVPSVSRLAVLAYGNAAPVLFEQSAPVTIRGGGQLYLGNQGAFYCANNDVNTAIGRHLTAEVVAMATSLSLFSIALSDSGSEEGTIVRLSFNGTNVLNLRGSAMTTLLPGSMITYLDGTLSIQKEGLPVQTRGGVVSFLLFDGLQLLNYSWSGPSVIVPGGSLYIDSRTAFYTESTLLMAQIASIVGLRNAGSDYSLTPQKTCQCLELIIAPTLTTPTDTPPQVASLFPGDRGQGSVAMGYNNAARVSCDSTHVSCDPTHVSCGSGTCTCTCNLQPLSSAQEHKGLKDEQEKDIPPVVPSATADGVVALHATPPHAGHATHPHAGHATPPHAGHATHPHAGHATPPHAGQVTGRGHRSSTSDGTPVTWITPVEGTVQFELAVTSSSGELVLYHNGSEVLDLTRARRISVPPDCSVAFDGSTLQVTSSWGRILYWYSNVASLVVFEDTPMPPGGPSSILPLSGGGQLFVDADTAFYSLSDPLSMRLLLQAGLPSLSSAPLLSFQYTITSSGFLVSLLARGSELASLDDLSVTEVEERPTLTLGGEGLVLVEGNSTSSFPDVESLSVTDGVNLWSYGNIQLSVEPGLLLVWEGGALYSSSSGLNEHISQLILNAQMSVSCISTMATVQEGVVSVLLRGNPVAQIKPENGDVCLSVAANQSFSLANGSLFDTVSDGFAFRGVRSVKTLTNCTLRTVYQSNATFVGPGELCVTTTGGGVFFFVLPSLSSLHSAYLHVVDRFQAPSLAVPSFPSTFVSTSGSIVSIGQSVGVFAGLHLTLLCAVTRGNPLPNIQWTLKGNLLGGGTGDKHAIDGFQGTMTIFGVDHSDAGEYKCTATNIKGSAQAQSVLTVLAAGVQQRAVLCQRVFNGTTFPVDPHSLPISQRPAPSIRMCLSNQMCPTQSYAFRVGDYGRCSASCQGGRQSRSVSCMELYSGTPVREVGVLGVHPGGTGGTSHPPAVQHGGVSRLAKRRLWELGPSQTSVRPVLERNVSTSGQHQNGASAQLTVCKPERSFVLKHQAGQK